MKRAAVQNSATAWCVYHRVYIVIYNNNNMNNSDILMLSIQLILSCSQNLFAVDQRLRVYVVTPL